MKEPFGSFVASKILFMASAFPKFKRVLITQLKWVSFNNHSKFSTVLFIAHC